MGSPDSALFLQPPEGCSVQTMWGRGCKCLSEWPPQVWPRGCLQSSMFCPTLDPTPHCPQIPSCTPVGPHPCLLLLFWRPQLSPKPCLLVTVLRVLGFSPAPQVPWWSLESHPRCGEEADLPRWLPPLTPENLTPQGSLLGMSPSPCPGWARLQGPQESPAQFTMGPGAPGVRAPPVLLASPGQEQSRHLEDALTKV